MHPGFGPARYPGYYGGLQMRPLFQPGPPSLLGGPPSLLGGPSFLLRPPGQSQYFQPLMSSDVRLTRQSRPPLMPGGYRGPISDDFATEVMPTSSLINNPTGRLARRLTELRPEEFISLVISIIICSLWRSYNLFFGGLDTQKPPNGSYFGSIVVGSTIIFNSYVIAQNMLASENTSYRHVILEVSSTIIFSLMTMVSGCLALEFYLQYIPTNPTVRAGISMGALLVLNSLLYLTETVLAFRHGYQNVITENDLPECMPLRVYVVPRCRPLQHVVYDVPRCRPLPDVVYDVPRPRCGPPRAEMELNADSD